MFNAPHPSGKSFKWPPWFKTAVLVVGAAWVAVEILYGSPFFASTGALLVGLAGYEYIKDARRDAEDDSDT